MKIYGYNGYSTYGEGESWVVIDSNLRKGGGEGEGQNLPVAGETFVGNHKAY